MVLKVILLLGVLSCALGHPIDLKDIPHGNIAVATVTLAFIVTVVSLAMCLCCKKRNDGFKEFTNPRAANVGFTNTLATEVAIFPPPGMDLIESRNVPVICTVESTVSYKPTSYTNAIPYFEDWFNEQNADISRQLVLYKKEMGKGWFGKVMEGEFRGTKVAVRMLKEGSSPEEKSCFLNEVKPFRDLKHKNILKLFAKCLEQEPYLLIFELNGNDLKNFLIVNNNSRNALFEQGICYKFMSDVAEGLDFMHENGFVHTDLAARNCLVESDLTVKIGDYGTSIDIYKNEYYHVGDIAVPIRWCDPETVSFTNSIFEIKQVTIPANIWSLAVILWEIAEFGKLPYHELSDDDVILNVFGEDEYQLPEPQCPFGQYLYSIMQICWKSENRATTKHVISMLNYFKTNPFQEIDFECQWKKLKPNSVPVVDNHTPIHSPRHTELALRPKLQAKTEFDSGVDLEINPDSCKTSTPTTMSQLSVASEDIYQSKKSPSLTDLKGSLDDVQFDSWLQGVEQKTEEDRTFVKDISEAIKNLDATLALEKTSSSSADSSIEYKTDFKTLTSIEKYESDTEDESWRNRIERGEFTEKVKEKSKSVTDLMVLTHIDSEESENDSLPSLTKLYSLKRNNSKLTTFTGIGFGSEGNIRNAIVREELEEKLRSLPFVKNETIDKSIKNDENLKLEEKLSLPFVKNETIKSIKNDENSTNLFLVKTTSEVLNNIPSEVQNIDCVPEIIITESELQDDTEEIVEEVKVTFTPRKFVFVCHETDDSDTESTNDSFSGNSYDYDVKDNKDESCVILGSCEEHTLDYFKGLKTTFSPEETQPEKKAVSVDSPKNVKIKEPKRFPVQSTSTKVGKSKSLDSVLSEKSETPFYMTEYNMSEDLSNCYDSYFSIDSGHSSDRCIDQDKQMNDLKTRLEDVMKYTDDFQLKSSEDEYGGKLLTPDDERSSDSGFRDKGSLSESVEDTCDEKYNLEDIDAELDDFTLKSNEKEDLKYYEQFVDKESPLEGWFLHPKSEMSKDNGWVSISTEDEQQQVLTIDADFAMAIRNELKEKLPCAQKCSQNEDTSPEQEAEVQFTYPSQLSPILEEQESNQSSIVLDSPLLLLPPPDIDTIEDVIKESSKDPLDDLDKIFPSDKYDIDDDVLVIDTETNEVTLIESPKQQSNFPFVLPAENFKDDDSMEINTDSYNGPLTPDISLGTNTLSSPENNMSGLYMSPCSVKSDLFDSGPPSLPFDLGQSLDEVEEISVGKTNDAVEIMQDIINKDDEILEKVEAPEIVIFKEEPPVKTEVKNDQTWLKDLFASEIKSPVDLSNWPANEELMSPSQSEEDAFLKPNITSTLALLSPDLSSNDSKCHSSISSYASTPTHDDSKILDSLSSSSKEYSVIAAPSSLTIGNLITVPMPSPEDADKGWRPTMCQLMELTDQAEGEEMTTSFIEPDENGTYTPDWESDTDDHSSSSSGEFVWKEGDKDELISGVASDTICLLQEPTKMERIDEEEEEGTTDTDDTASEGCGTEFVPSSWDPSAEPSKSCLKSSISKPKEGKRVVFQKEKYQCVYKYPREPEEDCFATTPCSTDYSSFNDWELGDVEIQTVNELDSDNEEEGNTKKQDYDFYRLNYNLGPHLIMDDGEFYISSSSHAFDWNEADTSEFFPGRESIESVDFNPGASELAPINLGELRHTKDTLRLELPPLNRLSEKAEATILDSGIDTASPNDKNV